MVIYVQIMTPFDVKSGTCNALEQEKAGRGDDVTAGVLVEVTK